ncbi:MAG: SDR family NAD(P)-dependent oxidoreductase [Thermoguttaceae bacterium]
MDFKLRDRVVLVTGAASGLGRSVATMLAGEGARVAVNYRSRRGDADAVVQQIVASGGTAIAVEADIASEEQVIAMFDKTERELGPIFALVNNAAYCPYQSCVDLSLEEFRKGIDINLQGTFLCAREAVRRMTAAATRGKIVNISSQAAFRGSETGKTSYDMAKAGIIGFTVSLARDCAKLGINVNGVAPGIMLTDIIAPSVAADPERYNRRIPLGRLGQTDEVAAMVVFLCSELANYMTGATVDVSGGLAMH